MTESTFTERRVQTICLLILTAIATGAALQALSEVMIPFALAVFFSIALAPVVDWLAARTRLSRGVSVGLTMLLGALLLAVLSGVVQRSLTEANREGLMDSDALTQNVTEWLKGVPLVPDDLATRVAEGFKAVLPKLLGVLGSFLSQGITVLIFLMFLLVEQGRVRGRDDSSAPKGISGAVESRVKQYISVKLLTSAVTGVLVGLVLWMLGVPAAVLFGLLTFLLNFIPTIGSVIAVLLPIPALLAGDASIVVLVLAIVLPGTIQFVAGQIWENKLLGDAFDLRASVVLLGLVFWGNIWGVVGMLLATPITAVMKTLMEGWDVTRPVAVAMGERPILADGPPDSDEPSA